jgi:hypothetical protein
VACKKCINPKGENQYDIYGLNCMMIKKLVNSTGLFFMVTPQNNLCLKVYTKAIKYQ